MVRFLSLVLLVLVAVLVISGQSRPGSEAAPDAPRSMPLQPRRALEAPETPVLTARSLSAGLPQRGQWRGKPALADLDGDGWPDLVASLRRWDRQTMGEGLHVWLADGKGGWREHAQGLRRDMGYGGAATGDVDGDGRLDVAYSGHDVSPHVFLNRAAAGWQASTKGIEIKNICSDVDLGDIDGDGHLDLVTLGQFPQRGGLDVFLGDGRGGFRLQDRLLPGRHYGAQTSLHDLDGDGRCEVLAVTDVGPRVWRHDGSGWRDVSKGLPDLELGGADLAILARDLDGDGKAELLIAGLPFEGHAPLRGFRLEGDRWCPWGEGLPDDEPYYDLACAQLEAGSPPSIVAAGKFGISVIDMTAPGRFARRGRIEETRGVFNVGACDVDRDGDDEVVYVGFGGLRVLDLDRRDS